MRLCTHKGGLPQGAPTSPALSNLLNYRLDARLAGAAKRFEAAYTRYADDITFSYEKDDRNAIHAIVRVTKAAAKSEGYELHQRRKLSIRRRHQRQVVTGLVVNRGVGLGRSRRRWLRAVEHHVAKGRTATLDERELAGWRSYAAMVAKRRA